MNSILDDWKEDEIKTQLSNLLSNYLLIEEECEDEQIESRKSDAFQRLEYGIKMIYEIIDQVEPLLREK
jgi:hypothetical protein